MSANSITPFAEGDFVRVDPELGEDYQQYRPASYHTSLNRYRGGLASITAVNEHSLGPYYNIDVDGGNNYWSHAMLIKADDIIPMVTHDSTRVTPELIEQCIASTGIAPSRSARSVHFTYDEQTRQYTAGLRGLLYAAVCGGFPDIQEDHAVIIDVLSKVYDPKYLRGVHEGYLGEVRYTPELPTSERNLGRHDGYAIRQHLINKGWLLPN